MVTINEVKQYCLLSLICTILTFLGCTADVNVSSCDINLRQDTTDIECEIGNFDFGDIPEYFSQSFEFTIENTGHGVLKLKGSPIIEITGPDKSSFVVINNPTSTELLSSEVTTFTIKFEPNSIGVKNAVVKIPNNDGDENPYIFKISGNCTAPAPEINVKQEFKDIQNNTGSYDFGEIKVFDFSSPVEFTIENNGNEDLVLSGDPIKVGISGVDTGMFIVNHTSTQSTVKSGESTTFSITFNPISKGIKTAQIVILNNDSDENPYTFTISGTGLALPEINIMQGENIILNEVGKYNFGKVLANEPSMEVTFTIQNFGSDDLELTNIPDLIEIKGADSSMFSVNITNTDSTILPSDTTTFGLIFTPTGSGLKSASLEIANNDSDENPYRFTIEGIGVEPEINVKQNTTNIPNSTGSYDFGAVNIGFSSQVVAFTIENLGEGDLKLSGNPLIDVTGSDSAMFSVNESSTNTPITTGNSTTFTMIFTPTSSGSKSATVSIANNDTDENPYTFTVTGDANIIYPEINIKVNSTNIPCSTGSYDFGTVNLGYDNKVTFTIENVGAGDLNLTGSPKIEKSGSDAAMFTINETMTTTPITTGNSTTFTINFIPTSGGNKSATISIANNDADENPYTFTIVGMGKVIYPDINVKVNSTDITCTSGVCDFGSLDLGIKNRLTFTIENLGLGDLILSGNPKISKSGTDAAMFTINETNTVTPVVYGNSTSFTITFSPTTTGNKSATISIANNDPDESPFTFTVTGFGKTPAPEIDVRISYTSIPCTTGSYNFNTVYLGYDRDIMFKIVNLGNKELNLTGSPKINVSGTNASEFIVNETATTSPIAASSQTTFIVKYKPISVGSKIATISIANDDSDENPYTFTVKGDCQLPYPEINVKIGNTNYLCGIGVYDFGGLGVGRTSNEVTFTIENNGTGDLTLTGNPKIAVIGSNASMFIINETATSSPIARGRTTTFGVKFNPTIAGTISATISIANDDSDENPYTFTIKGNGVTSGIAMGWIGDASNGWKTLDKSADDDDDYQSFCYPYATCVDSAGNIYISDPGNDRVCKWDSSGNAIGWIGGGSNGWKTGSGAISGSDYQSFNGPRGICIDSNGYIYVADSNNHRISVWDTSGNAHGWLGGGKNRLQTTTAPTSGNDYQSFSFPRGVYVDSSRNLYVADTYNDRICKWNSWRDAVGWIGGGSDGWKTAKGSYGGVSYQRFSYPSSVSVSGSYIFVGDAGNRRVSKWSTSGSAIGWIGGGSNGWKITDAPSSGGTDYQSFNGMTAVCLDSSGNIFVADAYNHRICKWDSSGNAIGWIGGGCDGWQTTNAPNDGNEYNCFEECCGVFVDSSGNIYIADSYNDRVCKWKD